MDTESTVSLSQQILDLLQHVEDNFQSRGCEWSLDDIYDTEVGFYGYSQDGYEHVNIILPIEYMDFPERRDEIAEEYCRKANK